MTMIYRVHCAACRHFDELHAEHGECFQVQHRCHTDPAFTWSPISRPIGNRSSADSRPLGSGEQTP